MVGYGTLEGVSPVVPSGTSVVTLGRKVNWYRITPVSVPAVVRPPFCLIKIKSLFMYMSTFKGLY